MYTVKPRTNLDQGVQRIKFKMFCDMVSSF